VTVTSQATESGGGIYPNGAEGFGAGALPPPGTYFLNYFNFYTAGSFKDKDGKDASYVPDFQLNAIADVFRLVHMTKLQLLGGNLGMQILVPVINLDVSIGGTSQNRTGLGDITVTPFIWAFHTKNFHYATALDVFAPTGRYDKKDMANIGRNYWTFEPIVGLSYISDSGCELSTKIMYDFNTKNDAVDYQSGQEFHFDYTLAKKFGPVTAGVGGYYYKQVTDDESRGQKVGTDGNKGQVFAIGPQLKLDYKNMSFMLKYQREMLAENKPEGDKFWFNLLYAF
jgi:hypothetical protein